MNSRISFFENSPALQRWDSSFTREPSARQSVLRPFSPRPAYYGLASASPRVRTSKDVSSRGWRSAPRDLPFGRTITQIKKGFRAEVDAWPFAEAVTGSRTLKASTSGRSSRFAGVTRFATGRSFGALRQPQDDTRFLVFQRLTLQALNTYRAAGPWLQQIENPI